MCELVDISEEDIKQERKYWYEAEAEDAADAEEDEGYPENDNQQML